MRQCLQWHSHQTCHNIMMVMVTVHLHSLKLVTSQAHRSLMQTYSLTQREAPGSVCKLQDLFNDTKTRNGPIWAITQPLNVSLCSLDPFKGPANQVHWNVMRDMPLILNQVADLVLRSQDLLKVKNACNNLIRLIAQPHNETVRCWHPI